MKGPLILWIIGLIGFIIIVLYEAMGLASVSDLFVGNLKINFIFPICYSIAISALTAFILGIVYEYVVKFKEGKEISKVLQSNNDDLIKKIPSIIANFDTFWQSLDSRQIKSHLYSIIFSLIKSDEVAKQFVKAVSSVENVYTNIWRNLTHSISLDIFPEDESVLKLKNTISFRERLILNEKQQKKLYFVIAPSKDVLRLLRNNFDISHYWITKIGFELIQNKLTNGEAEYGYTSVDVISSSGDVNIVDKNFKREISIEKNYNNQALIWSMTYTSMQTGEFELDMMYTISTFTSGNNPYFYIYIEKTASNLHVTVESKNQKIKLLSPKLFLRPDQETLVSWNSSSAHVSVNDVVLPGHGILFLFDLCK